MYQDDLAKLSRDELIALGLALAAQIEALAAQITELARRVAELEAKLGQPPGDPGQFLGTAVARAQSQPHRTARSAKKRKGRPGVFRALADNPGPDCREPRRALPALRARVAPG